MDTRTQYAVAERTLANVPGEEESLDRMAERALASFEAYNTAGQQVQPLDLEDLRRTKIAYEDDPDSVARRWGERRTMLKPEYQMRRLFHQLYMRAYEGNCLQYVDSATRKIQPIGLPGWFPAGAVFQTDFNRLRPLVNEIQAELIAPNGMLEVNPRSGSQRDMDAARAANKLVWYWAERKKVKKLQAKSALGGAICGDWFAKTIWDENQVVPIKDRMGNISRGMHGDVSIELVEPTRLMVDPYAEDLSEAEWVIEERLVPRTELIRQYPEAASYLKPQDPDGEHWGEDDVRHYFHDSRTDLEELVDSIRDISPRDPDSAPYRVYECYEKFFDPAVGTYWWRTVICRGYVLEDGVFAPIEPETGAPVTDSFGNPVVWRLPYRHWRYNESLGRLRGQGVMKDAMKPARFLHWLDALIAKIHSDAAVKIMVSPKDRTPTPFYDYGFMEMKVDEMEDAPVFINTGSFPTTITEGIKYYDEMLRQVVGRPRVVQGEAPANRSGKAINTLAAEAKEMFDGVRFRFDCFWQEVFEDALAIAGVMYTEERILGINEDDGAGSFAIKGADLADHTDVRMNYSPLYGHTRSERVQVAMNLTRLGAMTPQELRMIHKAGAHEEVVDTAALQIRRGREVVYAVEEMDEAMANQIWASIALIQKTTAEAIASAPDQEEQAARKGLEQQKEVLRKAGLGLGIFDDAAIQAEQIRRYGLMRKFEALSAPKRAILSLRYQFAQEALAKQEAEALRKQAQMTAATDKK